jgi:ATP-dependent Lon protease
MNFLETIATHIASQNTKQQQIFIAAVLCSIALLIGGSLTYLYMQRASDIETIIQIQEQIKKNELLMAQSERIKAEEERIKELLDENKGFSIKTFFETLMLDQKLKPELGWETEVRSIEGNDTFDEIILTAQFKKQTTQSLIALLNVLERNEIVYIKELDIKKEEKKTISFEIILATKKRKQFWEE